MTNSPRNPLRNRGFFVGRVVDKCQEGSVSLSYWFRENLKGRNKMTNPFTALIDWLDENADFGAPIGAFIGVAIAITLCFILGA